MPVNKVVFGHRTIIDISSTTTNPEDVVVGKIFYKADGSIGIGTLVGLTIDGSGSGYVDGDTLVLEDSTSDGYVTDNTYVIEET